MMNKDSIGARIANARKNAGLTQADVAEKLNVTFQAVSSWERDQCAPDAYNMIELANILGVSISSLFEERHSFKTQQKIFDWEHMKAFVKRVARQNGLKETLKAVDFAINAHKGQTGKSRISRTSIIL